MCCCRMRILLFGGFVKEIANSPLLAIPITNITGWLATKSRLAIYTIASC